MNLIGSYWFYGTRMIPNVYIDETSANLWKHYPIDPPQLTSLNLERFVLLWNTAMKCNGSLRNSVHICNMFGKICNLYTICTYVRYLFYTSLCYSELPPSAIPRVFHVTSHMQDSARAKKKISNHSASAFSGSADFSFGSTWRNFPMSVSNLNHCFLQGGVFSNCVSTWENRPETAVAQAFALKVGCLGRHVRTQICYKIVLYKIKDPGINSEQHSGHVWPLACALPFYRDI